MSQQFTFVVFNLSGAVLPLAVPPHRRSVRVLAVSALCEHLLGCECRCHIPCLPHVALLPTRAAAAAAAGCCCCCFRFRCLWEWMRDRLAACVCVCVGRGGLILSSLSLCASQSLMMLLRYVALAELVAAHALPRSSAFACLRFKSVCMSCPRSFSLLSAHSPPLYLFVCPCACAASSAA